MRFPWSDYYENLQHSTLILKLPLTFKMLALHLWRGTWVHFKGSWKWPGQQEHNSTLLEKYRKSLQPDVLQHWGHHESLTVKETSQQLLGKSQRGSSRLLTLRLALEIILA